jgi:hypothetical protein
VAWALTVAVSLALFVVGCDAGPPPVITPLPSTPRTIATLSADRTVSVGVAVAVGSVTPTPQLVGDYPTLVRPRLDQVQQVLGRLDQQLNILRTNPIRMAEPDWRRQTQGILGDLAAANADLRALGARSGADAALYAEVLKVNGDLDFVVSEYRMAFDFDPDATHFTRAGRAQKSTADEVESIQSDLRRSMLLTLTPRPVR